MPIDSSVPLSYVIKGPEITSNTQTNHREDDGKAREESQNDFPYEIVLEITEVHSPGRLTPYLLTYSLHAAESFLRS
jgi:hypothetical protein